MFTGLVQMTGKVFSSKKNKGGKILTVQIPQPLKKLVLGESIAVNGCCLTVIQAQQKRISFDVSDETLRKTTLGDLKKGEVVNLERAMKANDRLGGHFVLGHVDGVGYIQNKKIGEGSLELTIHYPKLLAPLLIEKGSVTMDGVSLTVCDLKRSNFKVYIIPHTEKETNIRVKKINDSVNLEGDVLGKYVKRLIELRQ